MEKYIMLGQKKSTPIQYICISKFCNVLNDCNGKCNPIHYTELHFTDPQKCLLNSCSVIQLS